VLTLMIALCVTANPSTETHEIRSVEGWNIRVEKALLEKEPELAAEALSLAEMQLRDLTWVLPEERIQELRQVVIVLDLDHPKLKGMQYHPSRQWLKDHGHAEDLALCVHIPQAKSYVSLKRSNIQPWVMLHEMAHAWHHQFLDFNHEGIAAAFSKAVEKGNYEKVMHMNGRTTRHYALTDAKEYFAEGCEAYFGTNDFHPFVRPQLKLHDPTLYGVIEELWNGPSRALREGLKDQ